MRSVEDMVLVWREVLVGLTGVLEQLEAGELTMPPHRVAHLQGQADMLRRVLESVDE